MSDMGVVDINCISSEEKQRYLSTSHIFLRTSRTGTPDTQNSLQQHVKINVEISNYKNQLNGTNFKMSSI